MDRKEIIRMAREAGIGVVYGDDAIERFAVALRAALAAPARKPTCVYPQCVSTTRTQCEAWALGACEERQDEASKRLAWTEDYGERS